MRTVELGLTAEAARLAGLADRAADRRALAYAAAFLLAASALVVLLVLAPGRARRAKEARAARRPQRPARPEAGDPARVPAASPRSGPRPGPRPGRRACGRAEPPALAAESPGGGA